LSGWNFKKFISHDEIKLNYSAILDSTYLSIVELIETNLVEILIQRQNSGVNLTECHQTTVNN
jgi:hypothetical protein